MSRRREQIVLLALIAAAAVRLALGGVHSPVALWVGAAVVLGVGLVVVTQQPILDRRGRARERSSGGAFVGGAWIRDVSQPHNPDPVIAAMASIRWPWWSRTSKLVDKLWGELAVADNPSGAVIRWSPGPTARRWGATGWALAAEDVRRIEIGPSRRLGGMTPVVLTLDHGFVSLIVARAAALHAACENVGLRS